MRDKEQFIQEYAYVEDFYIPQRQIEPKEEESSRVIVIDIMGKDDE